MAQVTGHRAARAFFFKTFLAHTRAQTGHAMSNRCKAQAECTFLAVVALATSTFNLNQ
jgi:hypothetical protein